MTSCKFDNWTKKCEDAVNKQIQIEYWASYQYHLMWSYFDRSNIALKNIAEFFEKSGLEEREHAHNLMKYQNLRGGEVLLQGVSSVNLNYLNKNNSNNCVKKNDVLLSFEKALEMEQVVYKSLLELHSAAVEDPQFQDFVESEYLEEQVNALNEISKYISQLKRIGEDGAGVWNFCREFKNEI